MLIFFGAFITILLLYFVYVVYIGIIRYMYGEPLYILLLVCQETFNRYKAHEFAALIIAQQTLSAEQLNEYRDSYIKNVLLSLAPRYKNWLCSYFMTREGIITFIGSVFDQLIKKENLTRHRSLSNKTE